MKNEQIVERTSFQRIRNVMSKIKKQHELIHKKKRFENFLKNKTLMKSQKSFCASTAFNKYKSEMNIMCL